MLKNPPKEESILEQKLGNSIPEQDTEPVWNDLGYNRAPKKSSSDGHPEPRKFKLKDREAKKGVKITFVGPTDTDEIDISDIAPALQKSYPPKKRGRPKKQQQPDSRSP